MVGEVGVASIAGIPQSFALIMGSLFTKAELGGMETVFPDEVVNASKAGDTYLLIFDASSSPRSASSLVAKGAHHALLVDVAGETTSNTVMYAKIL